MRTRDKRVPLEKVQISILFKVAFQRLFSVSLCFAHPLVYCAWARSVREFLNMWLLGSSSTALERADVCKVAFRQIFPVLLSCCVLPSAFVRALEVFEVFAVFVRLYYIGILLSFRGSPSCVTTGRHCGLLLQPSASGCAAGRGSLLRRLWKGLVCSWIQSCNWSGLLRRQHLSFSQSLVWHGTGGCWCTRMDKKRVI